MFPLRERFFSLMGEKLFHVRLKMFPLRERFFSLMGEKLFHVVDSIKKYMESFFLLFLLSIFSQTFGLVLSHAPLRG